MIRKGRNDVVQKIGRHKYIVQNMDLHLFVIKYLIHLHWNLVVEISDDVLKMIFPNPVTQTLNANTQSSLVVKPVAVVALLNGTAVVIGNKFII